MSASMLKMVSDIFPCDFRDFEPEIETLKQIRKYDEYTFLHCLNVCRLSIALGRRIGLKEEMIVDLGWAALLHDIGKLKIPIEVLNKQKKFTPEELAVMQSHPVEALAAFAETHPVTMEGLRRLSAAFEHHQRYDLKGYPSVQKKLTLHPFSRIVAVADTFDAMTTDRIYQRRVLPDVALKIMAQGFGTIFDPVVLQAFITGMGAYPVGTLVRLNGGQLAVVIKYSATSDLDRPTVCLTEQDNKKMIDLMQAEHSGLKIINSEFPEDYEIEIGDFLRDATS